MVQCTLIKISQLFCWPVTPFIIILLPYDHLHPSHRLQHAYDAKSTVQKASCDSDVYLFPLSSVLNPSPHPGMNLGSLVSHSRANMVNITNTRTSAHLHGMSNSMTIRTNPLDANQCDSVSHKSIYIDLSKHFNNNTWESQVSFVLEVSSGYKMEELTVWMEKKG